ncbi:Ig-like domain-containing protein [Aquimarina pacifica]|uniref:Ig-like domain-containing protein n=1 Tax=Aquimarina pacifica TaxID=1296415 RepID=UPI0004712DF6|nr:Ig-like domain-containing protein [Aquimarina pacifica]
MKKTLYYCLVGLLLLGCNSDDDATNQSDDNGSTVSLPVAVADELTTMEDTAITISLADLLDNDEIYEYGRITAFDDETENEGTVDANDDGYTYTPPTGFIGTDTFTYTLCDNQFPANCATGTVTIEVIEIARPDAADDTIEVIEDTPTTITTLLDNDTTLVTGMLISSIDATDATGTVVLNEDGTILYTPAADFVGEDSFAYTVCNDEENTYCGTATVTLTIIDQGNAVAVDDAVNAGENTTAVFSTLLDNDTLLDGVTEIASIDASASLGTVTLESDGTITYEPQTDYTGEDTFTYTLCDDDTPATCVTATVTVTVLEEVSFDIPGAIAAYYNDVIFVADSDLLLEELLDLTDDAHTTKLSYGDRHDYLYDADEDPAEDDNVILVYSGESRDEREYTSGNNSHSPQTFNTEHIYPQSLLNTEVSKSDLHVLRTCDSGVNTLRLAYPFADGSGGYALINGDTWYPGDDWRGDVARIIMYINMYYGDSFDEVGNLALFLEWNAEDPVSELERNRNDVIEGAQGNRNPFIDNPYLATLIWGGDAAENTWAEE